MVHWDPITIRQIIIRVSTINMCVVHVPTIICILYARLVLIVIHNEIVVCHDDIPIFFNMN
jgi:hypothetical protein